MGFFKKHQQNPGLCRLDNCNNSERESIKTNEAPYQLTGQRTLASTLGYKELTSSHFWISLLSECLSCYLYVFVVCSTRISWTGAIIGHQPNLLAMSLASGLAMMLLIFTFRTVHVNPTLTISFLLTGRIPLMRALLYVLVHCLGAIAAIAFLYSISVKGHAGALGLDSPHEVLDWWQVLVVEMVISFIVTLATYATCNYSSYTCAKQFVLEQLGKSPSLLQSITSEESPSEHRHSRRSVAPIVPQLPSTSLTLLTQAPDNCFGNYSNYTTNINPASFSGSSASGSNGGSNGAAGSNNLTFGFNKPLVKISDFNQHHQHAATVSRASAANRFLLNAYENNSSNSSGSNNNNHLNLNINSHLHHTSSNHYDYDNHRIYASQRLKSELSPQVPIEEVMQDECHLLAPNGFALHMTSGQAIVIGLAYALTSLCGIPASGASLNPARSLGPAFIMNRWDRHWIYWLGPILGAVIAGFFYEFIFNPTRGSSLCYRPNLFRLSAHDMAKVGSKSRLYQHHQQRLSVATTAQQQQQQLLLLQQQQQPPPPPPPPLQPPATIYRPQYHNQPTIHHSPSTGFTVRVRQ